MELFKRQPYYNNTINILRSGTWSMIGFILLTSFITNLYKLNSNLFTILILSLGVVVFFIGMFSYKYFSKHYINNIFQRYKNSLKFKSNDSSNNSSRNSLNNSSTSENNDNISNEQNSETLSKNSYESNNENLLEHKNNNLLNTDNDKSSEISDSSVASSFNNNISLPVVLKQKIHIFNSMDDICMLINTYKILLKAIYKLY